MNLADVFTFLFVILGFLIVYVGYWLMAHALSPQFTQRCAERIGSAPVKTTLIGAATLVPLIFIGYGISSAANNSVLKVIGIALALLSLLGALFGASGLALKIGEGMKSPRDEQEPWRRVMRGGIVLGLTFVMPILGWFIVMPVAFFSGFGAFLAAIRKRGPRTQPAAAPAVPATMPATAP